MVTNKRKIIIVGFFVWFLVIIVVGYLLLQGGASKKSDSIGVGQVNKEGTFTLSYDKEKPLYNTDAEVDIKYARVIYGINQEKLFVLLRGEGSDLINQINKDIQKIIEGTGTWSLLGWVVYYDNPGTNYLASAEYNIQTKRWDIFVNLSRAKEDRRETTITLIHEFAHILSLNNEQVNYKIPSKICLTHFIPEGCLKRDSYFYQFWKEFWQGNYSENELDVEGYASEHYQQKPDSYVTEYAATNPAEDFAESFMFFITGDDFDDKDGARKKIKFFEQYPEFIRMQEIILQNFKNIL